MAGWSELSAAVRGTVLVGAAAAVAVAGYFGLRAPTPVAEVPSETASSDGAGAVTSGDTSAVAPSAAPPAAEGDSAAPPAAETAIPGTAATEPAAVLPDPVLPSFDVARIAPDGAATVAGQAAPGTAVAILLDGVKVASVVADGQGKFAALFDLPPSPVARLLSLQATGPEGGAVTGAETVALAPVVGSATASPDSATTETAASAPAAPAPVLIAPEGVKVLQPSADMPAEMAGEVTLDTISYAPDGAVLLGGRAKAGTGLRIYLDGLAIADVAVAPDGAWAATLADVAAGIYTLRVDQLGADGTVTSRFETPFKRETLEALAAAAEPAVTPGGSAKAATDVADAATSQPVAEPATSADPGAVPAVPTVPLPETEVAAGNAMSAADPAAPAVEPAAPAVDPSAGDAAPAVETTAAVENSVGSDAAPSTEVAPVAAEPVVAAKPAPVSVTVQPGYTLWGIAQQNFGDGVMYVQVFEANKDKIKDPDLIYPGQVFTIPAAP